jgi:hypothetical protein
MKGQVSNLHAVRSIFFLGELLVMKSLVYAVIVVLAAAAAICSAAPKPAIVPGPDTWTVEVLFEHPRQMTLPGAPNEKPRTFWYTILNLTNRSRQDVDFYPTCDLMTDSFQIVPAGRNTPPEVFERIKKRHQSKYPFLESIEKADPRILQGVDNAKDIAIIWPDFDSTAKSFKLFISGLSNETAVVKHPLGDKEIYLRKTLELDYILKSDPAFRQSIELNYNQKRWVMR